MRLKRVGKKRREVVGSWTVAIWDRWMVTVPDGFPTDGASIPLFAQWLVGSPFRAEYVQAAVVHDWLCSQARSYEDRILADAAFLWLLWRNRVAKWRRFLMFAAVRWWGRFTYRPLISKEFQ